MGIVNGCFVFSPQLKELRKQFPKLDNDHVLETTIFKTSVMAWRAENNLPDTAVPTKEELTRYIILSHKNWSDYIEDADIEVANVWSSGRNNNSALSNFADRVFTLDEEDFVTTEEKQLYEQIEAAIPYMPNTFSSVEQAYQFIKMLLPRILSSDAFNAERVQKGIDIANQIATAKGSAYIKKLGGTRILNTDEIAFLDANKRTLMKVLMRASFMKNPKAAKALLSTGNKIFTHVEAGNEWKLLFPKLLTEVREELKENHPINLDAFNAPNSDNVFVTPSKQEGKDSMRIYLRTSPKKGHFEVVKEDDEGNYTVYFNTTDYVNNPFTDTEKNILFRALAQSIPAGSKVTLKGTLTKGALKGLNRLADLGFVMLEDKNTAQLEEAKSDKDRMPYDTSKTESGGITIDPNLEDNWGSWLHENPIYGIVAYRVIKDFNTKEAVDRGIIGNPFTASKYGTETATKLFYDWLMTGNTQGEPLATPEFRLAIIRKLQSMAAYSGDMSILYYKELNRASHANVLDYFLDHPEALPLLSETTFSTSDDIGYKSRTIENIEDTDATLALAVDFTTSGEVLTKNEAEKVGKYSSVDLNKIRTYGAEALDALLEDFMSKFPPSEKPIKLNIAGNALDTLVANDLSQREVNNIVTTLLNHLLNKGYNIELIRSGGQTGIDEAGIIAAQRLGIPAEVHTTKRFKFRNEDGQDIENTKLFKERFKPAKVNMDTTKLSEQDKTVSDTQVPIFEKLDIAPKEDEQESDAIMAESAIFFTRDSVTEDSETLYIFTDNTDRTSGGNEIDDGWYAQKYGRGGYGSERNPTTALIRGLDNAAPISTMKWYYKEHNATVPESRWTDADMYQFKEVIDAEIQQIKELWDSGKFKRIRLPKGGFAGKISQFTPSRVPILYRYLNQKLAELAEYVNDTTMAESFKSELSQIDASDFHRADGVFSSIKKRQRISLINKLFHKKVLAALEEETKKLNARLNSETDKNKQIMLALAIQKLRNSVVIKQVGAYKLYDQVKQLFKDYVDLADNNFDALLEKELANSVNTAEGKLPLPIRTKVLTAKIKHIAEAYKEMLTYWDDLLKDASSSYGSDYGVIIDLQTQEVYEEEIGGPVQSLLDEDTLREEEPYKDGWMVKVRELSNFLSMSNRVREAINAIVRRNKYGQVILDDLGYAQTYQASYIFAELISALKDMTSATQMMGMLEALQTRKPWAKDIVDAVKNDDRLFTSFYRVFRKDYLNMWVHTTRTRANGSVVIKTTNINKPVGVEHYFDLWRDNLEYGNVLDPDSIYNHNGELLRDKIQLGAELIKQVKDDFRELEDGYDVAGHQRVYGKNLDNFHKLLNMLGVEITPEALEEVLIANVDQTTAKDTTLPGRRLMNALDTIYSGLVKDMESGNVEHGENADLLNLYGSAFNEVANSIKYIEEDQVESSTRQGKKSLYAHTRPSYLTTLIKKLKSDDAVKFIDEEFAPVDFLHDHSSEDPSQHRFLNSLIEELRNNPEARKKLNHAVVLEFNRKEYKAWTPLDVLLVMYNQYNAEPISGREGYGWYITPLLSDAESAEFVRAKRITGKLDKVKAALLDKFADVVRQEYRRIVLVNKRQDADVVKIPAFDATKDSKGGGEFKFFPELNTEAFNKNGKTFFEQLAEVHDDTEAFDTLAKEAVSTIMEASFSNTIASWESLGIYDRVNSEDSSSAFKYFSAKTEQAIRENLEEFYWNSTYMQSQLIQLLSTDLAYYPDHEAFTKRALEFHSPTERLNVLAKWNGEYVLADMVDGVPVVRNERIMCLADEKTPSNSKEEIEIILDQKIEKGELTKYDKTVLMSLFDRVVATDAQALRTLKSFRATQIAADMWSDEAEEAYNNIRNNTWTAKDFVILWNVRKPYLYTQFNQSDGLGGVLRAAYQNKNAEMVMLAQAIFGSILHHSTKLRALSEFMEDNDIDVVMFGTAVKVFNQGVIDLNDSSLNKEQMIEVLKSKALAPDGSLNPDYIKEVSWEDYGIITATPNHDINQFSLVGTQLRRLIGADIDPKAELTVGNRTMTVTQWRAYFNAINTANIRSSFEAISPIYKDINKISELLASEIKSSERYSNDLLEAVKVVDGQFNVPIFDSTQSQKLQELLNSVLKSNIVKQKIRGGSLIQVTDWFLNEEDRPREVWTKDKNGQMRLSHYEAYISCPDERLYELLVEPDGSINIDKKDANGNYIVPEKYRWIVGYRIPTEDKYSMVPIRIKGFLPRQVGGVIILPKDITAIAGIDFDVDKLYMMYRNLKFTDKYNIKKAWDDFYKTHPDIVADIEYSKRENFNRSLREDLPEGTELDQTQLQDLFEDFISRHKQYEWIPGVQEKFSEWFTPIKDKYLVSTDVSVIEYKDSSDIDLSDENKNRNLDVYNQAKKNSKQQRDDMMIDLILGVLTNSDTVGKIVNGGNFLEQKRDAAIVELLENLDFSQVEELGGVEHMLHMGDKEALKLASIYKLKPNPLTPDTWITYQQRNMSGAALVPMAATQNASHAVTQLTKSFGITSQYAYKINGKRLTALNAVRAADGVAFISKNVGSYLTAFVDNAKDPVAGKLNINTLTANLLFLLVRLGHSRLTASLLLKQPGMIKVVQYASSGQYNINQAFEVVINEYKKSREAKRNGNKANPAEYLGKVKDFDFTDLWLAENIVAGKSTGRIPTNNAELVFESRQIHVLSMLGQLYTAAEALGNVVRATRGDSQTGGPGGNIAQVSEKIDKVEEILEQASVSPTYPLRGLDWISELAYTETEEDIINSTLPILTAMHRYGIRASVELLAPYFPQASPQFRQLIRSMKSLTTYGRISADTTNKIMSQFIVFLMTELSNDFKGDKESRDYYINRFPVELRDFKGKNGDLVKIVPLLKRLQATVKNDYNGYSLIRFNNVGKTTEIQSEDFRSDFRNLALHESTSELASKLFIYNLYRGFGFSPSGYATLIPTLLKRSDETDYVATLRAIMNYESSSVVDFIVQYIRNNLSDRTFVPEVSASGLFKDTTPPKSFNVIVTPKSSLEMKRFAFDLSRTNGEVVLRPFVCYTHKGTPYYYAYDNQLNVYKQITPLGNKFYQEYDAYCGGFEMESVIAKPTKQKSWSSEDSEASTESQASEQERLAEEAARAVEKRDASEDINTAASTVGVSDVSTTSESKVKFDNLPKSKTDLNNNESC